MSGYLPEEDTGLRHLLAGDAPKILSQLDGLTVKWIVLTHAHPGHTGAKDDVKTATQATTAMHLADATAYLKSADRYLVSIAGM